MATEPLPPSNSAYTRIADDNGERIVGVRELCGQLNVDGLIRLPAPDHALLQSLGRTYVHVNLEWTSNKVGQRYAIVPIIEPGFRRPDGEEVVPALDARRSVFGRCSDVMQRVPIQSVPADIFEHSLPTIRTPDALVAALLSRYAPLFPRLAREELLSRGCALTRLSLE